MAALSLSAQAQTTLSSPAASAARASDSASAIVERVRANKTNAAVLSSAIESGFEFLRAASYEAAAEVFGAIVEAAPREPLALYGRAVALFNLRRVAEAEPVARASVEAALARASLPDQTQAQAAEAKRRASDALTLLATILAVRRDNAGALASVTKAVELSPENFDAQLALGRALYGAGDPAAAAKAFRAAVALKADDARARFFLATALEQAGDEAGALAAYRELLAVNPDIAEGHLGVGVLLVKRPGDEALEGVKHLTRAVALNGNLYEARVALGRALIQKGRAAEAVEHLQRAAELAPNNPEPHYQLAIAYRRLGRRQEAEAESALVQKLHEARRARVQQSAPATVPESKP
ncbi:MAG TPA: tetratricopeptide repeat protein [Pyrinomonadaceae bacterium]